MRTILPGTWELIPVVGFAEKATLVFVVGLGSDYRFQMNQSGIRY